MDTHHTSYGVKPGVSVNVNTPAELVAASVNLSAETWENEHAIEVQVAALSNVLGAPQWRLVPILCGPRGGRRIAEVLDKILTPNDLVVFTCDLTHSDDGEADARTIAHLVAHEPNPDDDADAPGVIEAVNVLTRARSWLLEPLAYHRPSRVGYVSAVFYGPPVTRLEQELHGHGCFVTLTRPHTSELRGCRGHTEDGPVASCYLQSARAARTDGRFEPVREDEAVDEEVSVMSRRIKIPVNQAESRIVAGLHGVVLSHAGGSALFLPSVWRQFAGDKRAFLDALGRKAGNAGGFDAHVRSLELFTTLSTQRQQIL